MGRIKFMFIGLILGVALGFWVGNNLGRGRPLLHNPFGETTWTDKVKDTGDSVLDKGGELLDRGKKELKEKVGQ